MRKHHLPIAAFVIAALISDAQASQNATPGFDVEDLNSASKSDGAITPDSFRRITIALDELRKYPVVLERYKSIHLWQTDKYYYVTFSPNEIGSTMHGRFPSDQMFIDVQFKKSTMRVTGSRTE